MGGGGHHQDRYTSAGSSCASASTTSTRLAYVEVLDDERALTAVWFLRRAVAHFASYGITTQRLPRSLGLQVHQPIIGHAAKHSPDADSPDDPYSRVARASVGIGGPQSVPTHSARQGRSMSEGGPSSRAKGTTDSCAGRYVRTSKEFPTTGRSQARRQALAANKPYAQARLAYYAAPGASRCGTRN